MFSRVPLPRASAAGCEQTAVGTITAGGPYPQRGLMGDGRHHLLVVNAGESTDSSVVK